MTTKSTTQTLSTCCLICGEKITDDEFSFEDYFTVFRGHNQEEGNEEGFICFACIKETLRSSRSNE